MKLVLASVMVSGLVGVGLGACSKASDGPVGGKRGKLEYPVDVAKLETQPVQYTVTSPGSIDAFQQVQITARVAGAVDKVSFVEGQKVDPNAVLVVIESERYSIAVSQAQTALAKANAAEKSAEAALNRRLEAQKDSPGLVPGEEIEQKQTAVDTAKADVEAAKQDLKVAELNLRDSSVRTPIGGIVQTRTVTQGQYLQAGAVLATILQKDPMLLRFQVTEQDAPRMKPGMTANLQLKESPRVFTAKITLVMDSADPTTRMVPITAELDATDHPYWLRPGAFCAVNVPVGDARPGIVVPGLAIQPSEKGYVVYVLDPDKHIVHAKVVQQGMHTPDGGIELTRGVNPGDLMVVTGIDPLSDGAPVKVNNTVTLADANKQAAAAGTGSGSAAMGSDSGSAADAGSAAAEPAGSGSGGHHRKAAQ